MPDIVLSSDVKQEDVSCCNHVTVIHLDMTPFSVIALFLAAFYVILKRRGHFDDRTDSDLDA